MEHLGLLAADSVGVERYWRFHGDEAQKLHYMVWNHVAQSTGGIKISAALLHAHRLGIGDLHVIDIAAVPDRLKDSVIKAKDQDVLHGFFAQVMINAVDLVFRKHSF